MDNLHILYPEWFTEEEAEEYAKQQAYENGAANQLSNFSITGDSEKLRRKMLEDQFVLEDIAILGQWTTLYAAPNTGKTLLTLWLLGKAIETDLDGEMVYYINADDHFRGLVEKIEIAEEYCMHMIAPHHNDFDVRHVPQMMLEMAKDGSANGVTFILDTLKKFTDLMDKRASTEFGKAARGFVSAGGTLITLAHTNKHKNADGKSVYSGTSDIIDDSDCAYVLDKVSTHEQDGGTLHTVEFTNKKARGDVAPKAGFTYFKKTGQTYAALLSTVERIGGDDVEKIRLKSDAQQKLDEDEPIIKAACEAIAGGINTKDKLVKAVQAQTGESARKIRQVLDDRTGDMYMFGHRWEVSKEKHNKHVYSVLPTQ